MSDFIHVTLKENESLLVEPRRYDLVVDVSREAIMNDLNDEHSIVRQKFQAVPDWSSLCPVSERASRANEKTGTWPGLFYGSFGPN
jgi:hypothetical protein